MTVGNANGRKPMHVHFLNTGLLGFARRIVIGAMLLTSSLVLLADVLIDNFQRTSVAPWTFYNGAEFPGATGSLSIITNGYSGNGARLAYNFTGGGNYVSANLTLSTPQTCAAIAFRVRSAANIVVTLRVVDSSGQTLQYPQSRPLDTSDTAAWYKHVIALNSPGSWWGGNNNGAVLFPITGISILAGDRVDSGSGAVGQVDFDEVTAVTSTTFNLDPSVQPLIPRTSGSGVLSSGLGVAIHFTTDDRALDAIRDAGFKWVRTDLHWSAVETSAGVYNWNNFDALVNSAAARGLNVLFILCYGNSIYTGQSDTAYPPITSGAITAYGNYAEAAARHFAGKGVQFEVWNEPNISGFWKPAPNAAQYAAIAREAIARVHTGDPGAQVTTCGMSTFDFGFLRGYLSQGGGAGANALGVHPYEIGNPPRLLLEKILTMRGVAGAYLNPVPPIWDTEWGYTSTDFGGGNTSPARRRQAVLVARKLLTACAVGLPQSIYYDIRDDGTDPANREHNFGLLANDYSEKDAMRAVKKLTAMAATRTFKGFIHTEPSSLIAMRFDGVSDQVVVLWSFAADGPITITAPATATATDMFGAGIAANRDLRESDGPVYYTFPVTSVVRLRNRWNGTYLYMSGTQVKYGSVPSTDKTSWWRLRPYQGFTRLENYNTADAFMNVEHQFDYVESYVLNNDGALSSHWTLEDYQGFARLKNRWTGAYGHIENLKGYLQCTAIGAGAWSSHWALEPLGPLPEGTYKIAARHSGKVLDAFNHQTANGSIVDQYTYNGGNHMRWTLSHVDINQYRIVGVESGRSVTVSGASTADGAQIVIWDWLNQNHQKWTVAPTSGGYYSLKAVHSGKALDVNGSSTADGAKVQQWTYGGGNNQQWTFQAP